MATYSLGHEPSTLASHGARTAENSAAYLLPQLRPGQKVLDIGCGPGSITLDLAQLVAPGEVIGVDNEEAPLVAARALAQQRGDSRTRFEVADAQQLPFDDASFDVVHAHQVLQHLTDPVGALQEMVRVCRPGGWVAVREADYAAMAWYPQLPGMELWRSTYRAIALANGANPDAARRLRKWALAAGITTARLTASAWNYADTQTCSWWGNSQADRLEGAVFTRQAAALGSSPDDLAQMAAAWRQWGAANDAWFLLPNGELLAQIG